MLALVLALVLVHPRLVSALLGAARRRRRRRRPPSLQQLLLQRSLILAVAAGARGWALVDVVAAALVVDVVVAAAIVVVVVVAAAAAAAAAVVAAVVVVVAALVVVVVVAVVVVEVPGAPGAPGAAVVVVVAAELVAVVAAARVASRPVEGVAASSTADTEHMPGTANHTTGVGTLDGALETGAKGVQRAALPGRPLAGTGRDQAVETDAESAVCLGDLSAGAAVAGQAVCRHHYVAGRTAAVADALGGAHARFAVGACAPLASLVAVARTDSYPAGARQGNECTSTGAGDSLACGGIVVQARSRRLPAAGTPSALQGAAVEVRLSTTLQTALRRHLPVLLFHRHCRQPH